MFQFRFKIDSRSVLFGRLRKFARPLLSLFVSQLLVAACGLGGPPRIEIVDAAVLEAKVGLLSPGDLNFSCICELEAGDTITPAYMTIRNRGGEADILLKAETDGAVQVSFRKGDGTGELTTAAPVDTIAIPAWGRVEFNQDGYILVLTGVKEDLEPGQTLRLTLYFEKTGPLTVDAAVTPRN